MNKDFMRGPQRRNFDVRPEKRDGKPDEEEETPAEEEKDEEERSEGSDGEEKKEEEESSASDEGSSEGEEQKDEGGGSSDEDKGGGDEEKDEEKERACIVEGYAATFNSPYQLFRGGGEAVYEVIDRAAFDRSEMSDVILQYDHEGRVYARQSNGTLSLSLDARGLKVRADLGGTQAGRALYEEIRGGYTTRMSFAFTIDESDFEELPEERILGFSTGSTDRCYLHTIRKIGRVFDVSAVSIPANEGTGIEALRGKRAAGREDDWRARFDFEAALALAM